MMNQEQNTEKVRLTNIVGETKKLILDEPEKKKNPNSQLVSDEDVKKAIELLNPDPNSLKSRG